MEISRVTYVAKVTQMAASSYLSGHLAIIKLVTGDNNISKKALFSSIVKAIEALQKAKRQMLQPGDGRVR